MIKLAFGGVFAIFALVVLMAMVETVSTGHEAVGTRFGKVTGDVLEPGFHMVNPILSWDHFNTLQRTELFEQIQVPAADQQKATMDISVQYNIIPGAPVELRKTTGVEKQVLSVHFAPNVRGILRDAGRSTEKVEMFYDDAKIESYRVEAMAQLTAALEEKGILVTDVIVRDVSLPQIIATAIEAKKQREQEVERERAELDRIALEAQQVTKRAEANYEAEKMNAKAVRVKAEAEAFAIQQVTARLTPQYVDYIKANAWNGALPRFTGGGAVPFINLDDHQVGQTKGD
jgi:regulator of protease activity HflC (stomatin/prohibitin superfamily)